MGTFHLGPDNLDETYVPHAYPEHAIDLGELVMNYAVAGEAALPPRLLIPGQTESRWGYGQAIGLLQENFQCFAVDLRGQGRSACTPGRYTLDSRRIGSASGISTCFAKTDVKITQGVLNALVHQL